MKTKKSKESEGLGDTVAKFTEATGLDKIAKTLSKAIGKDDCGCERRREKLNKMVPYKKEKGHETGGL